LPEEAEVEALDGVAKLVRLLHVVFRDTNVVMRITLEVVRVVVVVAVICVSSV
jgi:hypothetical protein